MKSEDLKSCIGKKAKLVLDNDYVLRGTIDNVSEECVFFSTTEKNSIIRLDAIKEPNAEGSMLDHTVVLFGSGMGYGGTHSNRNLPILVAGGRFRHLGHVDARDSGDDNMPLCNLFVTLLQRFGIERDQFNTSTGRFGLDHV